MSYKTVYNIVKAAVKEAKIPFNLAPHYLRHACITHQHEEGKDLEEISKHSGHAR